MKLEDLSGDERTLVVVALQALHRERLAASNAVFTVCSLAGKEQPPEDIFGLREVQDALRRMSGLNTEKEEACRTLTPVRRPVRSGRAPKS